MKQTYELQVITPVHVGSGGTLNHIDGYYANNRWYHVDLDKVLQHPSADINALTSEMSRRGFQWERYLSQRNIDIADVSTYSLACSESPGEVEIREAIKGVRNRPYVPGSTLKGAIRTALLEEILSENNDIYKQSLKYLERDRQPARQIEKSAFGKDPNHDLLRALQVSDTTLVDSDSLEIGMAWTVTLNQNDRLVQKIDGGSEYKNFVQQIQRGQRLTFTLKTDDFLLQGQAKTQLGFKELQKKAVLDIAEVCRASTHQFVQGEKDFFSYYNLTEIADRYDELERLNTKLPEGSFLLQIGWGTGYNANTVTSLFTEDEDAHEDLLMDLRERFRLGESRSRRGNYDDREFPKTRRILYRGQNPLYPLGWVKISPIQD